MQAPRQRDEDCLDHDDAGQVATTTDRCLLDSSGATGSSLANVEPESFVDAVRHSLGGEWRLESSPAHRGNGTPRSGRLNELTRQLGQLLRGETGDLPDLYCTGRLDDAVAIDCSEDVEVAFLAERFLALLLNEG